MTCSTTRIEADRRNAQKSTGPETDEGKARSGLKAFRHGVAGAGDLLGPMDDAREVDARAAEIAEETGARGRVGRILARRAAAMSLRLERAEEHALVASAERARAARDEFDRDRSDELDALIDELEAADDPRPTLTELEGSPEGVRFLAESWAEMLQRVRAGGDDGRARRGFGTDGATEVPALTARAEAELARLRRLAVELDGTAAPAIAEHRAATADLPTPTSVLAPAPAAPARIPAPPRTPPPPRPVAPPPLASFRLDAPAPALDDLLGRPAAAPGSPEARRNRPDLARVAACRR